MFNRFTSTIIAFIILSVIVIISVFFIDRISPSLPVFEETGASSTPILRVVIDPGHGGKDGGAVSVNGANEKDINLDVSLKIRDVMHVLGYEIVMTRDSDTELTHPDGGTRKMQDLKGRLTVANNNNDAVFVSIHMNKFPIEKYGGLQVYYSPNDKNSYTLAAQIQKDVSSFLQKDNKRTVKKADSSIFLLDKIKTPAVLIECGFLSNIADSNNLDDPEYRLKLSSLIAKSICMWYNVKE